MRKKDHYEVLGVKRTEDDCGIRTAFRKLAKKHHPDISGPEETRHFQEILEAYTVLMDPVSRASYNENLRKRDEEVAVRANARPSVTSQGISTASSPRASVCVGRSLHARRSIADEVFDLFLKDCQWSGFGSRGFQGGGWWDLEVVLSTDEAIRGGILPLFYPVPVQCRFCGGLGHTGFSVCKSCHGQGVLEREEAFRIVIPAGIKDGSMLRVPINYLGERDILLRIYIRVINS